MLRLSDLQESEAAHLLAAAVGETEGPFMTGHDARVIFQDPASSARAWAIQGRPLDERPSPGG